MEQDRFEAMLDQLSDLSQVAITFDDGNTSDIEIAYPALRDRGLRASFFILAGRLGTPGSLGVDDIRQLVRDGMTIGSHGRRHCDWTTIDQATLEDEVAGTRRELESVIGAPVTGAACPFGAYDRRVLRALRDAGYREVYTSDGGPAKPEAWLRPRNTVTALGADRFSDLMGDARKLGLARTLKRAVKRRR